MKYLKISLVSVLLFIGIAYSDLYHITKKIPFTIQEAIDAASDGDTVLVGEGTWTGEGNKNLDFKGKSIVVMSRNGPEATVIDCEGNGRGFYFHSGEDQSSMVIGFTITGGDEIGDGLGVYCENSSPIISNCVILQNNVAFYQFELLIGYSQTIPLSEIFSSVKGGGVYANNSNLQLINCNIHDNRAAYTGGGIYAISSNILIIDSVINNNLASYHGGGIYAYESTITLNNCEISYNSVSQPDYSEGGGIYCENSYSDIINCLISSNESGGYAGGIRVLDSNDMQIDSSIISYNYAQGWEWDSYGGGITGSPDIYNSIFIENYAYYGGGIYGSVPHINNCVFWGNNAGVGGAIDGTSPQVINCTIIENSSGVGGFHCFYPSASITNSILWMNDPVQISGEPSVTYSDIEGGWEGEGNIDLDPLFIDPDSLDFRLLEESSCIDAGDPTFDVPPGGGRRIDIGAYEYWFGWNIRQRNRVD